MTLHETAAWLQSHDNYLLLTHRRPDGDTLGSAAALCCGLRQLGKRAAILENPQVTPKYQPYIRGLSVPQAQDDDLVISIDLASEGLFPLSGLDLVQKTQLAIDHHGSNSGYATASLIRSECAACGEIIYSLLQALHVTVTKEIAEALYVAISTDTGCFRYSNVTSDTLRIAADLVDCGAQTYQINKALFETKRFARLQLEAHLIQTVSFYGKNAIGICEIPMALRRKLAITDDDLDDISGFARDIEGVEIGVMVRQQEDGSCKLSVRSSPAYDASAICAILGGGGHKAAAGAMVKGDLAQTKMAILHAIGQVYPHLNKA